MPPYPRLATVAEQKAYERAGIEEAKRAKAAREAGKEPDKTVDTPVQPVVKVDLTEALEGHDLSQIARENGFWKASYSKLGPGQLRMTVGNVLRGRLKKGLPIKIGGKTVGADKCK